MPKDNNSEENFDTVSHSSDDFFEDETTSHKDEIKTVLEKLNPTSSPEENTIDADMEKAAVEEREEETEERMVRRSKQRSNSGKKPAVLFASLVGVAVLAGGIYTGIGYSYFKDRYFPGTFINEYDCSGKTVEEAYNMMDSDVQAFKLNITKNGTVIDEVPAKSLGLNSGNTRSNLQEICDNQHKYAWARYYVKPKESHVKAENVLSFDQQKYDETVGALKIMSLAPTVVNQNARVVFNTDKYIVQPEVYGDEIDKEKVKQLIGQNVVSLNPTLEVSQGCYTLPSVTKEDQTLIDGAAKANQFIARTISIQVLNQSYEVGKATMNSWFDVNEKGGIIPNQEKIDAYAHSIFATYTKNAAYVSRQFQTAYGDTVTVYGGDYGRIVDEEGLSQKLTAAVNDINISTVEVPFLLGSMGNLIDDIGGTYAEVDLTNQHMWMHYNGQVVVSTDVITGAPGVHATPQGTYRLKYMQSPATLKGPGYETKVSYWMPFNMDIGLHDAVWQPSFGGGMYAQGYGSHGCVNLPYWAAQQIYSYAEPNMPVVCYYH